MLNVPSLVIFLHASNMMDAGKYTGGRSQGRTSLSVRVYDEVHYLSLSRRITS